MPPNPTANAISIAGSWLVTLDLAALSAAALADVSEDRVDIVALGKAAAEMTDAASVALGERVARRLIVSDGLHDPREDAVVVVGEHPVPGVGSLAAAQRLIAFLGEPTDAQLTLFLVSGGASSLCAWPADPLGLDGLALLWRAALAAGVDITTLNRLRAATSMIAGGAVLRSVTTARSRTLIMVDNVVSGAPWVASGFTYEYRVTPQEVADLLERVNVPPGPLAERVSAAAATRRAVMRVEPATHHDNLVVADPALLLDEARSRALELGYDVHSLGAAVQGDVEDAAARFGEVLTGLACRSGRHCVIGVGEVTVHVRGSGVGGRCQEFAWTMAPMLADLGRPASFVARTSDGRDYVEGVGGAWVDADTTRRVRAAGLDWATIKRENDSHRGLDALGQLIEGAHTGWNLCDLYVAVLEPGGSSIVGSL